MKITKSANNAARRVFRACQADGRLDEAKFSAALKGLAANPPRDYRGVLNALKRLVRLEMERRQVTIESATDLDTTSRVRVEAGLVAKYGSDLSFSYRTSPELLGGLKIRVGNDVFDGSVKNRLDRLAAAF